MVGSEKVCVRALQGSERAFLCDLATLHLAVLTAVMMMTTTMLVLLRMAKMMLMMKTL